MKSLSLFAALANRARPEPPGSRPRVHHAPASHFRISTEALAHISSLFHQPPPLQDCRISYSQSTTKTLRRLYQIKFTSTQRHLPRRLPNESSSPVTDLSRTTRIRQTKQKWRHQPFTQLPVLSSPPLPKIISQMAMISTTRSKPSKTMLA